MDLNSKVTQLEDEIKVLKKEVQAVLLDLRENMLNRENPFSPQPPATIMPAITVNQAAASPAGKAATTEGKNEEEPPAVEEELPATITGAFQPDEIVELPAPKEAADASEVEELVLAWKPAGGQTETACMPGGPNTRSGAEVLETITSLVGWVEASVTRLGSERTQAILDISEMMGHMSTDMKGILVKFMRPGPEPVEKVSFKDYMASLIELAGLLGRKNDPNNVLFYTLYHGMYSMTEGKEKNG